MLNFHDTIPNHENINKLLQSDDLFSAYRMNQKKPQTRIHDQDRVCDIRAE